jgi:hypothetical protein
MNPKIPIALGVAGMLAAVGTAIANANGAFAGHPHLSYWFYAGAVAMILVALILAFTTVEQKLPHIVATRYGQGVFGTGIKSRGYHVGESGLILVNDGEPAYEIGTYSPFVTFGTLKLRFSNTINRLTREDGEAQISTWIERSEGGAVLGSGLFEIMRQEAIREVSVPVLYKGAKNRWYKSICKIERDVTVSGGLGVKTDFRGRTRKPKITE